MSSVRQSSSDGEDDQILKDFKRRQKWIHRFPKFVKVLLLFGGFLGLVAAVLTAAALL